ncbi:hypothetical protein ABIE24_002723 [Mycetocola sp. 2940]
MEPSRHETSDRSGIADGRALRYPLEAAAAAP